MSSNQSLAMVSSRLTIQEKIDVINLLAAGMDRKQIQEMFGIKAYHIKDILKRKDRILAYHQSGNDLDKFAVRYASFPTIDAEVGRWLREMAKQGISLDGKAIKAKAMQVAHDQGIHDFKASYCWITKMKKRQLGGPTTPNVTSGSKSSTQRQVNHSTNNNNHTVTESNSTANGTNNASNVNFNLINVNGNNQACLVQGSNRQVNEPTTTFIFSPSWFAASMGIAYYPNSSPSTEVRIQPAHQQPRSQVAYPTNPRVF